MTGELVKDTSNMLNELIRMHSLNIELLEALGIALKRLNEYADENDVVLFEDEESIRYLLSRVINLYEEITKKPSDDFTHKPKSYGDYTAPTVIVISDFLTAHRMAFREAETACSSR